MSDGPDLNPAVSQRFLSRLSWRFKNIRNINDKQWAKIACRRSLGAFELMELLVVLGMVVIVSVCAWCRPWRRRNPTTKVAQCLNVLQLTLAWQMYAADNSRIRFSVALLGFQAGSFQTSSYMDWTSSSGETCQHGCSHESNQRPDCPLRKKRGYLQMSGDYYQKLCPKCDRSAGA